MAGRIILALLFAATLAAPVAAPEDPAAIARDVLKTTPLIDGHNDLFIPFMDCRDCPRDLAAYDIGKATPGDTDIPRWQQGMVGGTLLNVFGPDTSLKTTLDAYDLLNRMAATYADRLAIAGSAAEVRQIFKSGRIALIPTLENARRLQNDPAVLHQLHGLGLRAVTLAYKTNDLADAADDTMKHGGLSPLGATMVRAMNITGVLVDLSHTAPVTMHEVLDLSSAPVIFSHSSARALTDVERNVPDSVLRRLPKNGGIVMVSFVPCFTTPESARWEAATTAESDAIGKAVAAKTLSEAEADKRWAGFQAAHPAPKVSIAQVADHIEHISRIAGVDHVGIGSDFDGMTTKVAGLEDVSTFPALFTELARRGWSKADLAKLAGENFLRVMAAAEAESRRLQAEARAPRRAGGATFVINSGGGHDRIYGGGGQCTVQFGPGITPEQITPSRDADGNVVLTIAGTDDGVTFITPPGSAPAVGLLRFADGRVIPFETILATIGTAGQAPPKP